MIYSIINTCRTKILLTNTREHDPLPQLSNALWACDNCQQEKFQQENDFYSFDISLHAIVDIKSHKKFKGKKSKRIHFFHCFDQLIQYHNNFLYLCFYMRRNQETFTLYQECNVCLTSYTVTIVYNKERVVWCSFIWFILKDTNVH